jgi:soluble lytic murein transglycosylase-like protein
VEIRSELAAVARRIEVIEQGPRIDAAGFAERVRTSAAASRGAIDRSVKASAQAAGIDPALIQAIISAESGFDSHATSRAGARGLMQLMPETAASLGVADAYDPQQNVRGGTRYLRELLDRFGTVELAVAAYNAGPAAVERFGGVPPYAETQAYVRNVMARFRRLHAAQAERVFNSEKLR